MIFAVYECIPGQKHPALDRVGGAFVNCWLRVRSFAQARALAERDIRSQHWRIVTRNEIWRIPRGHYQAQDSGRRYYEQALTDREVYVYHLFSKYPAYCVDFEAVSMRTNRRFPQGTPANVKYWVMNNKVSRSANSFDDFWGKAVHKRKAICLGRKRVQREKWRVTAVRGSQPVNSRSFPKESLFTKYYEEAEDYGDCIAFWIATKPNSPLQRTGGDVAPCCMKSLDCPAGH